MFIRAAADGALPAGLRDPGRSGGDAREDYVLNGVHIHRTRGSFVGQVRRIGCRNWETVTGSCLSAEAALSTAVNQMENYHKRARALFVPSGMSYYEPHVAMEALRR